MEVYVQLSVANEMFASDTLKLKEEREEILRQTGITQEKLDNFVARYSRKPEKWAKVWKKIVEKLSTQTGGRLPTESGEEEKGQKIKSP